MRNVRGRYGRMSWTLWSHRACEACVSHWCVHACTMIIFSWYYHWCFPGFLTKTKKILECICVNCGKLKADIVSHFPYSLNSPILQIFWGLSPLIGEPQTLDRLNLASCTLSVTRARLRSLDRREGHCTTHCCLDPRSCGEIGGLNEECEK